MNEPRKAQHWLGLAWSWPRLTTVFLIDVALLALASHLPDAWQAHHIGWWVGVALAAMVTAAATVTYRRTPLTSVLAARVLDRFTDPEAMLVEGRTPPVDHRHRFARDVVGIREYRGRLIAVIAVQARPDALAGRHRHPQAPLAPLPVAAVAAGLRQFDLDLEGIDIVAVATRRRPTDRTGSAREGSAPEAESSPPDQRDTWLVLRMDPQRNLAAVAARDSVASALAAATERLAHDLDGSDCAARPLTAEEIAAVDVAVLAGLQPAHVRARRSRLNSTESAQPAQFVASFWISPQDITSETLAQLWVPDAEAMVLTVRLTPVDGRTEVSAWVRYHSRRPLPRKAWEGLNRLTGRQLAAVCASLPVPARRPRLETPARTLAHNDELAVAVGAAQQSMSGVGTRW
ncbi:MAG: type VII secretion protein EccE [Mycobacterium sp.]|uniref:type VII secretion protein EccE n=1 Tax=Mycobacterium sp. TaxID=1785 RepID=UPI00261FCA4F|nr:type VII secretion protein EccE [Mycobacterium sp.]MDI3315805.1 type VII secretion protein EccE [Mycobacterium sp.]